MDINICAIIVSLAGTDPAVLRLAGADDVVADIFPSGEYEPDLHKTLESGLFELVKDQTGSALQNCEQLLAVPGVGDNGRHVVTIGYLALLINEGHANSQMSARGARWKNWYGFLPWEDWRNGRPALLDEIIIPQLQAWANHEGAYASGMGGKNSAARIASAFGLRGHAWSTMDVVARYALMLEAGLLAESVREGLWPKRRTDRLLGNAMGSSQRRMLAIAIERLRKNLEFKPVIRSLMSDEFTLTQLQECAEGILGTALHKQNFRRQIDNLKIVEKSGNTRKVTGGRPAALYRFIGE